MKPLPTTLESQSLIQYQDCDPFNHLNNARYIDLIMAVRTQQILEHYGINMASMAFEQGIGWVTAQTQISYLSPATWMETVTIETRLIKHSNYSVWVEGLMWNAPKDQLKAIMWSKLVHYNLKTLKSHPHNPHLMELFEKIKCPHISTTSFDERLAFFKN
ncbi:MAG TPA: acyl-CoA thioesterase [Phnomibacter sp.]|nr:acyl-CoA thioesterase [Phnomibacter sp.]